MVGQPPGSHRGRHRRRLYGLAPAGVVVLVLVLFWLVPAPAALAHAFLADSDPPAGASLTSSPEQLVLVFSEGVVARFSKVQLTDAGGRIMPGVAAPEAVPGRPEQLIVRLTETLPTGLYSVNMLILSVDGHVESQSFRFGVGVVVPDGGEVTSAPGFRRTGSALSAGMAAGRWLLYCGLVILIGGAAVSWLTLRGAIPPGGRTLLRAGWALAAAGAFTVLLVQQQVVASSSLLPLLQSGAGRVLGEQAVAVGVAGIVLLALELYPHRLILALLGVTAAVAMLFHVLGGHAGASLDLRALNVAAQWIHLVTVGVWAGGLLWLLLAVRRLDRGQRHAAVQRFSTMAGAAFSVVVVTGAFRAAVEIGSPADMSASPYGLTLLLKLGLVTVIVALAALNRFRLVPALAGTEGAVATFGYNAGGELAVGTVVLAVTAVLVGLAP